MFELLTIKDYNKACFEISEYFFEDYNIKLDIESLKKPISFPCIMTPLMNDETPTANTLELEIIYHNDVPDDVKNECNFDEVTNNEENE